jgi:CrcB protein
MNAVFVMIGGAIGSLVRYWMSEACAVLFGTAFPWGTLVVNVSGSFIIGYVAGGAGAGGRWMDSGLIRHFVMIGLCGGYTTFSAFSLQTVTMLQAGDVVRAGLNATVSLSACLVATAAGFAVAAAFGR